MIQNPKRRKYKDNPYEIKIINEKYFIYFKDSKNKMQELEVSSKIYEVFNESELHDLSELNEYDRHIEHSELFDITLFNRTKDNIYSLEQEVEDKILNEELQRCISQLPEVQRRRIIKYYFENMTQQEIANDEGVDIRAVQYTLNTALKNLKKILK